MSEPEASMWAEWNEESSKLFIDYGRYFVPEREQQIGVICDLIPPRDESFHILELCCGEGLLAAALLERFPACVVHGFDGSTGMLQHARQRLARYGERFVPRRFDLREREWRAPALPLQAIVSSLAVHHLDAEEKQQLYSDAHAMLSAGGALLIADLIQPVSSAATMVAARMWDEAVRARAQELDGNLDAFDFFRREHWNYYEFPDAYDKPSPLFHHLRWLEQAGFEDVDAYWLKAGHAIYGGRKT
ncbi:MAG: tRNA (cmo5U34)-methyltransferase [Blastocatellia bacterium]|jgi:SAM-dependent methyltransferase|nr:tRNA (cmo5U34)-methyltransferase [Blastocatellia bacterium]